MPMPMPMPMHTLSLLFSSMATPPPPQTPRATTTTSSSTSNTTTRHRDLQCLFLNPTPALPPSPADMDFVRNLRPRLAASERWRPRPRSSRIRIDLSKMIREAIVSEVENMDGILGFDRGRKVRSDGEYYWEPIRKLKTRLKEFEKNSEFVGKVKSSLKSMCKEPEQSKVGHFLFFMKFHHLMCLNFWPILLDNLVHFWINLDSEETSVTR